MNAVGDKCFQADYYVALLLACIVLRIHTSYDALVIVTVGSEEKNP